MTEIILKCDKCGAVIGQYNIRKLLSDDDLRISFVDDVTKSFNIEFRRSSVFISDEFVGHVCKKCMVEFCDSMRKNSPANDPLEHM